MFEHLFRFAKSLCFRKQSPIRNQRIRKRLALQLEQLEDRAVPAGLVVTEFTPGPTHLTGQDLVNNILGTGVGTPSNIQLIDYQAAPGMNDVKFGNSSSAGSFVGGGGIVGFANGIVLSTGGVQNVVGPNASIAASQDNTPAPGDTNLSATLSQNTYDATVLSFDFVPQGSTLAFQYVFSSDEYNIFTNPQSQYDDGFGAYLNDVTAGQSPASAVNVAVLPSTTTGSNRVSVQNVNTTKNSSFFINNDITSGAPVNTEMNGLTTVLSVSQTVVPGHTYHIKLVIADASDSTIDSNVFVMGHSFTTFAAPVVTTSQATVTYGTPVTFTATETAAGIQNTDTVSFYDGSTFLGNGVLQSNSGGTAVWTYTTLPTQLQGGAGQPIEAYYNTTGSQSSPQPAGVEGDLAGGETVLPHALTISATAIAKTYDSTTSSAATPLVSGLQGNDSVSGLSESFASANAGILVPLSVNPGYTVNDGNAGNNYTVTIQNAASANINKAALTITAQTNTKAFDSKTSALATPTVAGLIGADTVTGLAEVYTDRNVGSSKTLSVSSYTVSDGNSGNNYTVTTVTNTTGVITKAALTITAVTNTKAYDSTTSAAAKPIVAGLFGGDTVTGLAEVYSDPNAGTGKTLSVSSYTVNDGSGGNNYTVTTVTNTTGVINKAALTIFALTNTKTYDSTTTAAALPTVTGLIGGDSASGLAEVYSDKNAGFNKTLSVSSYTITDGNSGNNYAVTTVADVTGVINRAALTITATTNTKTYDSTTSAAATPTVTGSLVGGDSLTALAEAYAFGNGNVGTGKTLSVSAYTLNDGNGGNNYAVTTVTNTTGAITKAGLTITALTNTKPFDSTTSAAAIPTVSGLLGGDSVTGRVEVYTDASVGTGKTLSVSAYTVNDNNGGNNYTVTTVANNTGVITKATLTITAATNTKTYDSTTSAAATPIVTGLVGNDTVTGLAEVYSDPNAGSSKTLSVSAYTVNDGNGGNDYTVTTVTNTTGLITKASLTITAATNTKTYDSTTSAGATPTVSGLIGGDTATGLAEVYSNKNAGTSKTLSVSAYTISDGNSGNNYAVTTVTNTTGVINKASLTITATTFTKTYDSTTAAGATPTVSGLIGGDTVTGLAEVFGSRDASVPGKTLLSVSAYTVVDGNSGNNYSITTVNNLTGVITQAPLTIIATTNTKNFDSTVAAAAVPTVIGLQGADTVTGLAEVYSDPNAGSSKTLSVSAYTVVDGFRGHNYSVTTVANTTGVINKATLTITATTNTKTYDATTSAAAIPTVSGLIGTDTATGLAEVYADPNVGTGKTLSVSAYTIVDGNGGNNYTVTTVTNTTGVITKVSLTITAVTNTKAFDSTTSAAATPTVAGLLGTDSATGLVEVYSDPNTGTGKTLSVSAYTINDGNGGNNYSITTVLNTTGVITKATVTITATTNTKPYDSTTSAAAIPTVSGLFGGDSATGLAEVYADPNAGTGKTLSVSAYTINDGNGGNNYTVVTVNDTTGVITKALVTITATTNTKTYDGNTSAAALPTVSGLIGNATVTGLAEVYSDKNAGSSKTLSVSAYTITDGNSGNNYAVVTVNDTTGLITQAPLTITATTDTKSYDGNTSAAAVPTVAGLVGGDTASGLAEVYSDPNIGSGKTLSVSAYTINDGNGGNNYTVTTVDDHTGLIFAPITPLLNVIEPPQGSTFTVYLLVTVGKPLNYTFNYSTSDGTAIAGTDYMGITTGTLHINAFPTPGNPNPPNTGLIPVTILGDAPEAANEPLIESFHLNINYSVTDGDGDVISENVPFGPSLINIKQIYEPTINLPASQTASSQGGPAIQVTSYYTEANIHDPGFFYSGGPSSAGPGGPTGPLFTSDDYAKGPQNAFVNYNTVITGNTNVFNTASFQIPYATFDVPSSFVGTQYPSTLTPNFQIPNFKIPTFPSIGSMSLNLVAATPNVALVAPTSGIVNYMPQIAVGQPTGAPGGVVLNSVSDISSVVSAAEAQWVAAGASPLAFKNVQFQIGNIGQNVLAQTVGSVITIDAGAAGFGWYMNVSNADFQANANSANMTAIGGTLATGHMDLLTVIEHELGHILGLVDIAAGSAPDSLMTDTLAAGVRRAPAFGSLVVSGTPAGLKRRI